MNKKQLVLSTVICAFAAGAALAADICVFVADEDGKTIYVGQMKARLTVTAAGADEPTSVNLRPIEIESGHHATKLDHDGVILTSSGDPELAAEIAFLASSGDLTTSHYRGNLRVEGGWNAVLEVDLPGGTRTFTGAHAVAGEATTRPSGPNLMSGVSYPLSVCLISDEPFTDSDDPPIPIVRDGRTIQACCKMCLKQFDENAEAVIANLDKAIIEHQRSTYPLAECPVSGEELGGMGDPVEIVVPGNRLVRLCCGMCAKKARASAEEIVATLDKAVYEAQMESYPVSDCIVCDGGLGDSAVEYIHGTRLVRLCCTRCVQGFEQDVEGHIANLDHAAGKDE